jgi:hypothetical protein
MSERKFIPYHFGHEIYYDVELAAKGKVYPEYLTGMRIKETGEIAVESDLECPKCNMKKTTDGHDPCIPNLPGVRSACCGHGVKDGYIMFENRIAIDGNFERRKDK